MARIGGGLRRHPGSLARFPSGHQSRLTWRCLLGLLVGFGSNLLNVVRAENRFVLHNGYHRACALRALGIKYAPCIIQTVTRRDELAAAASQTVVDAAAFYLKAARPPLLKDFFDSEIRKIVPVRPARQVVEVSFDVREFRLEE